MKLSIITINYNNAKGLLKTLASVASQTFRDFEHIIVDGGSTDGSVEIIREYADNEAIRQENSKADKQALSPNHLITSSPITWISEPDKGIYNAMNKGIEIALGKRMVNPFNRSEFVEDKNEGIRIANAEYLLFLNSGDYLVDEFTIDKVFEEANDVDIIYGDRINVYADGAILNQASYPDKITGNFLRKGMISHQASFIKSDLFVKYGLYREDLKYASDWEFFLKTFLLYNCTYQHIHQYVVYYDRTGISSTIANNFEMLTERNAVFSETLPAFTEDYTTMDYYEGVLQEYDKRANRIGKRILVPLRILYKVLRIINHKIFG